MDKIPFVDAHVHLWRIGRNDCRWPGPDLAAIHRDFEVAELLEEMDAGGMAQAHPHAHANEKKNHQKSLQDRQCACHAIKPIDAKCKGDCTDDDCHGGDEKF